MQAALRQHLQTKFKTLAEKHDHKVLLKTFADAKTRWEADGSKRDLAHINVLLQATKRVGQAATQPSPPIVDIQPVIEPAAELVACPGRSVGSGY